MFDLQNSLDKGSYEEEHTMNSTITADYTGDMGLGQD